MPLQNRVDPWGRLHAVSSRGLLMGNRGGRFQNENQTLGKRRWASTHWIACELHFKNRHRDVWRNSYTELFFLDEVTALAAGHRPCFECRRAEAKAFLGDERVNDFDRRLHAERLAQAQSRDAHLPDGAMIEVDGAAFAVRNGQLLRWSFDGYAAPAATPAATARPTRILTPPSIVAILAGGYKPRWHPTATKGEET